MMIRLSHLATAWLLAVSIAVTGCGDANDYDGPQRAAVSGTVTYDGEPIADGAITFIPKEDGDLRKASTSISEGKYTIPEAAGPNFGEYLVQIESFKRGSEEDPDAETTEQILPPKFNEESDRTITIDQEEMEEANFDLKP